MSVPQVFISRPTVLTDTQAATYRRWLSALSSLEFEAVALDRAAYAPLPWNQLRDLVGNAHGALVLGFRQMSVEAGCWRPGTDAAGPAVAWLPTSWNQVEAGLAIMASLPVLVVPEAGIADGVFSPKVWKGNLYGMTPDRFTGRVSEQESVKRWARAVRRRALGIGLPPAYTATLSEAR